MNIFFTIEKRREEKRREEKRREEKYNIPFFAKDLVFIPLCALARGGFCV